MKYLKLKLLVGHIKTALGINISQYVDSKNNVILYVPLNDDNTLAY